MIKENISYDYDPVLLALLESNDHAFSGGRAVLRIKSEDHKIKLGITAKDKNAYRAMITSINNTIKILEKAKSAI